MDDNSCRHVHYVYRFFVYDVHAAFNSTLFHDRRSVELSDCVGNALVYNYVLVYWISGGCVKFLPINRNAKDFYIFISVAANCVFNAVVACFTSKIWIDGNLVLNARCRFLGDNCNNGCSALSL